MNKKLVKENYIKKIKLLKKYNLFYYDKSDPLITDEVYDNLKKEIIILENNYKFLKSIDSPSQILTSCPNVTPICGYIATIIESRVAQLSFKTSTQNNPI